MEIERIAQAVACPQCGGFMHEDDEIVFLGLSCPDDLEVRAPEVIWGTAVVDLAWSGPGTLVMKCDENGRGLAAVLCSEECARRFERTFRAWGKKPHDFALIESSCRDPSSGLMAGHPICDECNDELVRQGHFQAGKVTTMTAFHDDDCSIGRTGVCDCSPDLEFETR